MNVFIAQYLVEADCLYYKAEMNVKLFTVISNKTIGILSFLPFSLIFALIGVENETNACSDASRMS